VSETKQLAALARLAENFERDGIEYWLFGGWAVDFYAGSVTRAHEDLDIAVWSKDGERIRALLTAGGWTHAPEPHLRERSSRAARRAGSARQPPLPEGRQVGSS
jgi:hypothetical protein